MSGVSGEGERRGGGVEGECGCVLHDGVPVSITLKSEDCWLAGEAAVSPSYASVLCTHTKLRIIQLQNIAKTLIHRRN